MAWNVAGGGAAGAGAAPEPVSSRAVEDRAEWPSMAYPCFHDSSRMCGLSLVIEWL